MAGANGARKAPSSTTNAPSRPTTKLGLVDPALYEKIFTEKDRKTVKLKSRKPPAKQSNPGTWSEENKVEGGGGVSKDKDKEKPTAIPTSPLVNPVDEKIAAGMPSGTPFGEPPDMVTCRHCKKPLLRIAAPPHIRECLKKKQEKLQKKKEAKEAKDAALRKERNGGVSPAPSLTANDADGTDNRARKTAIAGDGTGVSSKKSGKKRKADDEGKGGSSAKKKKKEDLGKLKAAKAKGPVDVERQCGVQLNNGAQCARSLTCKSHSMGAKRAVPGRSMPYDILLQQYQKKNQAKQQRAAMDANAPLADDFEPPGTIDSDEERDAVMAAITRSFHVNPYTGSRLAGSPLISAPIISAPAKYKYHRMKDMLRNALSGTNGHDLFATRASQSASAGFFGGGVGAVEEPFEIGGGGFGMGGNVGMGMGSRRASMQPGRGMHPGSRKPSLSGQI
ncbi:SCA7-domain-containing protein [Tothia fuscella]|uniref:SCA7-domain-containing protein n=1 Tax=Tothia fuscella TaxID=1048955 RepID=A0A9P4NUU7_9PEZI|nr:SCA7-domain-containing protein [Tothia fuscella]